MAEVENIKSALKRAESNKVITFPVKIMDITSLEQGDIMNVKEKVDILVNNIPFSKPSLSLCGNLCKRFCEEFDSLEEDFSRAIPLEEEIRCSFVEKKLIFHTKILKFDKNKQFLELRKVVRCLLKWTDHFQKTSIGLTPIGCGMACEYETEKVAQIFLEEINAYFLFHPDSIIKKIHLVSYESKTHKIMESILKNILSVEDFMKFDIVSLNEHYDLKAACDRKSGDKVSGMISWGDLDTARDRKERLQKLIKLSNNIPKRWTNYSGLLNQHTDKTSAMVNLEQTENKLFKAIEYITLQSWNKDFVGHGQDSINQDNSKVNIKVTKIFRYENPEIFAKFSAQRNSLLIEAQGNNIGKFPSDEPITNDFVKKMLPGELIEDINETFLFHGTSEDKIENILDLNFDPKWTKASPMFGMGVYFSESATKADQYVGKGEAHKILLSRVLLGSAYHATTPLGDQKQAPMRPGTIRIKGKPYDSIIGTHRSNGLKLNFREFIVKKEDFYYPEYIIEYERIQ